MDFKVAYIFRSPSGGWSETFYESAAALPTADFINAEERRAVLDWRGGGVTLQAKKWIEEGGLRRSHVVNVNALSPRTGVSEGSRMEVAGIAVKMRLNFDGGGGRVLQIRGLADSDIIGNESGEPQLVGQGLSGVNAYLRYIVFASNPYQGRRLQSIGVNPWKTALTLEADSTNANWTKVTIDQADAGPIVGDLIYFRGIDPLTVPYIQGVYRVVKRAPNVSFSIPTIYRGLTAATPLRNVQWRTAAYEYPNITSGSIIYVGTRDTAAPFGRRRGARSRRKVRL